MNEEEEIITSDLLESLEELNELEELHERVVKSCDSNHEDEPRIEENSVKSKSSLDPLDDLAAYFDEEVKEPEPNVSFDDDQIAQAIAASLQDKKLNDGKSEDDDESDYELGFGAKDEWLKEWQQKFEWDAQVSEANKMIFGNQDFRDCQREIINATKAKRDALALIPTGGGKSLTFQLSAVTDNGITFVFMPLLSLIEDNLNFVINLGIPAVSLSQKNSGNVFQ